MQKNPLTHIIFDYLLTSKSWKIHTLASELTLHGCLSQLDTDYNKNLFKRNFLIMNALFELETIFLSHNYNLHISSLDIRLIEKSALPECHNSRNLRDYYLNWDNYDTNQTEIDALLMQFWQDYLNLAVTPPPNEKDIKQSLKRFNLPENATDKQIQQQWRKLALKYHPDKTGGDKQKFQQLQNDWEILKVRQRGCKQL